MATLAECLELISDISEAEKKALKASASAYLNEGHGAKSSLRAVEGAIKSLEAEKTDILAQVAKQHPDLTINTGGESPTIEDKPVETKEPEAEKPAEPVQEEIVVTNTEVEVDMPEEEADKLTPLEQKKYLIAEIDEAIKVAPNKQTTHEDVDVRGRDKRSDPGKGRDKTRATLKATGMITIHVPGDGDFDILNTKSALKAFKKKVKSFPTTPTLPKTIKGPPSIVPGTKRLTDFEGEYYNEFRPRKQGLVEREEADKSKPVWRNNNAGMYDGEFFTNSAYIVKVDSKPKIKGRLYTGDDIKIKDVFDVELEPAEVVGEGYYGSGTPGERPFAHIVSESGKHYGYSADMIDSVLTLHPTATSEMADSGMAVFKVKGKNVGAVMPVRLDGGTGEIGTLEGLPAVVQNRYKAVTEPEVQEEPADDIDAMLDEVIEEVEAEEAQEEAGETPETPTTPKKKTAKRPAEPAQTIGLDSIIEDAAKEGLAGAEDAIKGLYELFGGGAIKSFPGGFDEETYQKAKPHFQKAYDHIAKANKGVKDATNVIRRKFSKFFVEKYGRNIKPYLKKFLEDVKAAAKAAREAAKAIKDEAKAAAKAAKDALGHFVNRGFVYDPENIERGIRDVPPETAVGKLLKKMVASKVWKLDFMPNTTYGMKRLKLAIQDMIVPFSQFVEKEAGLRQYSYRHVKKMEERILNWMNNPLGSNEGVTHDMDDLLAIAEKYGKAIQDLVAVISGKETIGDAIAALQEYALPSGMMVDAAYPNFNIETLNSLQTHNPVLWHNNFHVRNNGRYFYELLTDKWQNMIIDEQNLLLSEIDFHIRGGNQEVVRTGLPNYRENITLKETDDFKLPFRFNGVGFGTSNWINQTERNRVIPAAFDAFKDLANLLKTGTDKAMGLNKMLAVQFANLGHKARGAAAAYFPDIQTINFTRDNGDGTASHEWSHALHDYARRNSAPMYEEINNIIHSFRKYYDFDAGARMLADLLSPSSTFMTRVLSRSSQPRLHYVIEEAKKRYEDAVKKTTDYQIVSSQIKARGHYTTQSEEMWARAFEAYVYDKLGGRNNYLVNDFVKAGRIGGTGRVPGQPLLIYPAGVEREYFNETIEAFFDGVQWDADGAPSLRDDYNSITLRNERRMEAELEALLETVEDMYNTLWRSEPSADGNYWYKYDLMSFGPEMQPDGYIAYDKEYKEAGQHPESWEGKSAVAYLTQLHPDLILQYKLTNIQHDAGETTTYVPSEERGDSDELSESGEEALDEVSAEADESAQEGRDAGQRDPRSGETGQGGAREAGTERGPDSGRPGDSSQRVHPPAAGNHLIQDTNLNEPDSLDSRFTKNLAAIRLLNRITDEGRSPERGWVEVDANGEVLDSFTGEKDTLAEFTGWGGMEDIFSDSPDEIWKRRAELLKAEMTDAEWDSASNMFYYDDKSGTHYTPAKVARFMWDVARRLGFTGGQVLDPAFGGNGIFTGTIPGELASNTSFSGVESDVISARIASLLYEDTGIANSKFEKTTKPLNRYDLTITNVPVSKEVPSDTKHNKKRNQLPAYFINKMLNLTAPGALTMVLAPTSVMDERFGDEHLTEFAEKADLIGAFRLPSNIYNPEENVTTDLLVFRKKLPGSDYVGPVPVEGWTTRGQHEDTGLTINNYFINNPQAVVGTIEKNYSDDSIRVAPKEEDLIDSLTEAIAGFPGKIVERGIKRNELSLDDMIAAPGTIKEGGLYINENGDLAERVDGKEHVLPTESKKEKRDAEVGKAYVGLLDKVRAVLRAQKVDAKDSVVKKAQKALAKAYNDFVNKFGAINDPKNVGVYIDRTDSAWVVSLEEYNPDENEVIGLSKIFTEKVVGRDERPTFVATDAEAFDQSLDEFGFPNIEYIAGLRNISYEQAQKGIADQIIENPETGFMETMPEYLSGNVRGKLEAARIMAAENPEYQRNVSLLEAVLPDEIEAHRITARIGATWIDPKKMAEFVNELIGIRGGHYITPVFNLDPVTNDWEFTLKGTDTRWDSRGGRFGNGAYIENKAATQRNIARVKNRVEAKNTWGTARLNFFEILGYMVRGRKPVVQYPGYDGKLYIDAVSTVTAEAKATEIQARFERWLFEEQERADETVRRFNERVNTHILPNYSGDHLTLPGKSLSILTPREAKKMGITDKQMVLWPHQMNAVWQYVRNGNIYLAHEVGAGKTATLAMIAMEAKRIKNKRKIVLSALGSTRAQIIEEIKNFYPMANVLSVTVPMESNKQAHRIALAKIRDNDFDIAVIRHEDLNNITMSPDSERVFLKQDLKELQELHEAAQNNHHRIRAEELQVLINEKQEEINQLKPYSEPGAEKALYFDDLGIDLLMVDEAHIYKNIKYRTLLTKVTGLNPQGSPRADEFFKKAQYMNAQYPAQDGLVLASGTPLTNSIAELYNLQRVLQPKEIKRQKAWAFDRWITNHGDIGVSLEWDGAKGDYKTVKTNRSMVNAGRLMATVYQNIDSVRAKDTPIERPEIRGGKPQKIVVNPNQYVEDYKQIVLRRIRALERDPQNAMYDGRHDNILRIISNMSAVAIDQRLLFSKNRQKRKIAGPYADTELQEDSKIYKSAEIIRRRWEEEHDDKGVQLVFADLGTPKKKSGKFEKKTPEQIEAMNADELEKYRKDEVIFENESPLKFNTYDALKDELIRRGIPKEQIAFIHDVDHSNDAVKASNQRKLFKKVRDGDVRVLIGSTEKAGTGLNVQDRVSDIHHLDVWWNYSAWEQRNGRGLRAGNDVYLDKGVYIWNYSTKTTVDATRWSKIFAKGKVLNAVLSGNIDIDVIEDINAEILSAKEMEASTSGNKLMGKQADLVQQVQRLKLEHSGYRDSIRNARKHLAEIPMQIQIAEGYIEVATKSNEMLEKITAVKFAGADEALILKKHGKQIAVELKRLSGEYGDSKERTIPLAVFGTHKETTVEEEVDGKKKKIKKVEFTPLPVTADITRPERTRIFGEGHTDEETDSLWAAHKDDWKMQFVKLSDSFGGRDLMPLVDIKERLVGNTSRYISGTISSQKEQIKKTGEELDEIKAKVPKLEKVIDTPWAKEEEFDKAQSDLVDVEREMSEQGGPDTDPEAGLHIEDYSAPVPMIEDFGKRDDDWHRTNGMVFNREGTIVAFQTEAMMRRFSNDRSRPFNAAYAYNTPDIVDAALQDTPINRANRAVPTMFTTVDGVSRFWVNNDGTFYTVDPALFQMAGRIVNVLGERSEANWYVEKHLGKTYLVHATNKDGVLRRDAAIIAEPQVPLDVPENVQNPPAREQYSIGEFVPVSATVTLDDMKRFFAGQDVGKTADGVVWVKTKKGYGLQILSVDEVSVDGARIRASYGRMKRDGEFVYGKYENKVITLQKDLAGKWTLAHEAEHWLEDIGLISGSEQRLLRAKIERLVKGKKFETLNKDDIGGTEDRAAYVAEQLLKREQTHGAIRRMLNRIADFIDGLVNIFTRTTRGIVRDIETGAVYAKDADLTTGPVSGAQLSGRFTENSSVKSLVDNGESILADLKDRFGKGYTDKDMKLLAKAFNTPYVLGKKFPSMAKAVNTEIAGQETRTAETYKWYEDALGDVQESIPKNKEHAEALEKLIWSSEKQGRFPKKAVPTDWHKPMTKGEDIEVNPKHYREVRAHLLKKGVAPEVVHAFITIRRTLDNMLVDIEKTLRNESGGDSLIKEYRANINKIHNYFPHKRHGDSRVVITTADEKKTVVYSEHYYTKEDQLRGVRGVKYRAPARAKAWLKAALKSGELSGKLSDYNIGRPQPVKQLPDEVFFNIPVEAMDQIAKVAGRDLESSRVQYEAERLYNKEGSTPEEALALAKKRMKSDMEEALAKAISTVFQSRGWAGHAIHRKGIPGFEKGDVFGVLHDYISGYAGFKTKITRAREHGKTLRNIDAKKNPGEYQYVSQYVRDMLANQDNVDRLVDTLRAAFFVKYLGFVVKSGMVNLTQNVVMAGPVLSVYTRGAHLKLAKAMADTRKALTSKEAWTGGKMTYKHLSKDEQAAIQTFIETGAASDLYLKELKGNLPGRGWGKHLKKGIDMSGIFMQTAEKFNRTSTGLAAYRVGKENGMGHDEAVTFAKQIVYDSHFLYGKANMPSWARGGTAQKFARAAYTFRSFTHNYLGMMAHLLSNQGVAGKLAFARSLRNIFLMGGLSSIPFFEMFARLLSWLIGDDDEDTLTKIRGYLPHNWMKDIVVYGLPGLFGIDLSGSLSIEVPRNFKDIIGVPYAMMEDTMNMIESLRSGDTYRAVSETPVTPMAIRNAMRGLELYTTGQRTRSGRDVNRPGERGPKKISGYEAVRKGVFGLQPTSVSKGYKQYESNRRMEKTLERKQQLWANRYVHALRRDDDREKKKILKELFAWNARAIRDKKYYKIISIGRSVQSRLKPNLPKKRLRRESVRRAQEWK